MRGLLWIVAAALYGQRTAPRRWRITLGRALVAMGFMQCIYDDCVYIKMFGAVLCIVVTYVDDLLIMSEPGIVEMVDAELQKRFVCEPARPISRFLGMVFKFHETETHRIHRIDQTEYIDTLLERADMSDCNAQNTPMDKGEYPMPFDAGFDVDVSPQEHKNYRRDEGGLIFLAANTRFDLSLVAGVLGRNVQRPARRHLRAMKRVMRYLKGTRNVCLEWKVAKGKVTGLVLRPMSDADWAGEPSTRRSTTGQAHFLNGLLAHWSAKLQVPLTLSSTESETVGLSATGRAARGIENLLREVLQLVDMPLTVELTGDNHASLFITKGEASLRKVRHLDLADLYCRILAAREGWSVAAIGSLFNVADMGTKILDSGILRRLMELAGLRRLS